MSGWSKFWLAWAVIGFLVEMYVIIRGIEGGTLSEQLWFIRDASTTIFSGLLILIAWSLYHFRHEGQSDGEGAKSFAIAVGVWLFFIFFLAPATGNQGQPPDAVNEIGGGGPLPTDL